MAGYSRLMGVPKEVVTKASLEAHEPLINRPEKLRNIAAASSRPPAKASRLALSSCRAIQLKIRTNGESHELREKVMNRIGLSFWIFVVASPVSASASIGAVKMTASAETTNIILVDFRQGPLTPLTKEQEEALRERQQRGTRV